MLEIWGRKNANQVIQVLWTLAELEIDYQRHSIGTRNGDLETEEYKSLNPNSKIPTIRDNGFVMWESHAIIRYLARQYGLGTLYPDNPQKAAIGTFLMNFYVGIENIIKRISKEYYQNLPKGLRVNKRSKLYCK